VAHHATGGEICLLVVRICGAVVILGMAAVAIRWQGGEVAVHVAGSARHAHVRSGERKRGLAVIECGAHPTGGVVARCTRGREACMRRSVRALEIGLVTAIAIGWEAALVVIVDVA